MCTGIFTSIVACCFFTIAATRSDRNGRLPIGADINGACYICKVKNASPELLPSVDSKNPSRKMLSPPHIKDKRLYELGLRPEPNDMSNDMPPARRRSNGEQLGAAAAFFDIATLRSLFTGKRIRSNRGKNAMLRTLARHSRIRASASHISHSLSVVVTFDHVLNAS